MLVLGRDLGPAIDIGPAMTRKILKANGQIVYRSTVRPFTLDEIADETLRKERVEFTESVNKALGDSFKYMDFVNDPELEDLGTPTFQAYVDDDDEQLPTAAPDADNKPDADPYDQYVGAEVTLPTGDKMMNDKVRKRKQELNATLKGRATFNPILDTRTYEVEFADGQGTELAANVLAQNMYAQCDSEGNQYLLLAGIVDHKKDTNAVERADMYVKRGSNQQYRKTTKGWYLCVEWKDGSTSCEQLADLKESNPVEVADYAVAHGIDTEPAFIWWVPYTTKRRDGIIAAVNKRYHK